MSSARIFRIKRQIRCRKRVQRLLRTMGIMAGYPQRNLSLTNQAHQVCPCRLWKLTVDHPDQAGCADITYVPMARAFVYRLAVMDGCSRKALSWRLSNTMDSPFCVEALEDAIERHGIAEIFNTDQGSQSASQECIDRLKREDIRISMDGKGRWLDNVFIG